MARLTVAAILALSAVRASGPKDDLPAAFFHPLPGACFPADAVTASVSVPGSLFRAWPAARGPPQWRLLLNGREAAGGALDGGSTDDGWSLVLSMPGLADGHYSASFVVFASAHHAGGADQGAEVSASQTHFWVDVGGGCISIDALPKPDPPLPATSAMPWTAQEHAPRFRTDQAADKIVNLAEGQPVRTSSRPTGDIEQCSDMEEFGAENAVDGMAFRDWVGGQELPAPPARTRSWLSVELKSCTSSPKSSGLGSGVWRVDVLGAQTYLRPGAYPEVVASEPFRALEVLLLLSRGRKGADRGDEDRVWWTEEEVVARRVFTAGSEGVVQQYNLLVWQVSSEHLPHAVGSAGSSGQMDKGMRREEGMPVRATHVAVRDLRHHERGACGTDSVCREAMESSEGLRADSQTTSEREGTRCLDPDTGLHLSEVAVWGLECAADDIGGGSGECERHCARGTCVEDRCECWSGDYGMMGRTCGENLLHAPLFLPPVHPLFPVGAQVGASLHMEPSEQGQADDEEASEREDESGQAPAPAAARLEHREGRRQVGAGLGAVGPAGGWWDQRKREALLEATHALQHPETCAFSTAIEMHWDNTGLSAIMFFLSGLLQVGGALGRAMLPSDRHPFVFGGCASQDFACVFVPWSNCSLPLARAVADKAALRTGSAMHSERGFPVPAHEAEDMLSAPETPLSAYASKGRLWVRMVLLRYLFRLNRHTAAALRLRQVRADLGLDTPFIAWHVRLHVQDELRLGRAPALLRHLEAVRLMAALYNLSTVFVATDDAGVAERAAALCPELAFRWYGGFNRSKLQECGGKTNDCWLEGRLARGEVDANHMTNGWLVDVKLLSYGHVFVGQWGSNLSRLAYLLAVDRRRSLLPFISLDGPWRFSHLPMGLFA